MSFYRADIDGLRAWSILLVIIFHAFPDSLPGGFIGVDVFFVISGFLITKIILNSFEKNNFSYINFFSKRIKRLYPSLITVLISTLFISYFFLNPLELKNLGKYIFSGAFFISNLVLWSEISYFNDLTKNMPLLHLWSLGVEEQFYIFLPIALGAANALNINKKKVIYFLFILSFTINIVTYSNFPEMNFYSPFTRFWEILMGSILAINSKKNKNNKINNLAKEILTFICFTTILLSSFFLSKDLSYPSYFAIIPVFCTGFIIFYGEKTIFSSIFLSNNIAKNLGKISYPLYLWHWPILAFISTSEYKNNNSIIFTGILLSIILSSLTYFFIEKKLRFSNYKKLSPLLLLIVFIIGIAGIFNYKREIKIDNKILEKILHYSYDYSEEYREGSCFLRPEQHYSHFKKCPDHFSEKKPNILIWGDSHAAHLYQGFQARFASTSNLIQRTASGCPPIIGFQSNERPECLNINQEMSRFLAKNSLDSLYLAAAWNHYDLKLVEETLKYVSSLGIPKVYLIGPVPQWDKSLSAKIYEYLVKNKIDVIPGHFPEDKSEILENIEENLKILSIKYNLEYISPRNILCNPQGCRAKIQDNPLTLSAWDYGHLTKPASVFLVNGF